VIDQREARPWPGSTVAMLVAGVLAVSMIAALGNATYLLSRSGARAVSSLPPFTSEIGPGAGKQYAAAKKWHRDEEPDGG
jgi:hypothetical protein